MKTTLRTDITLAAICDGFTYNEFEGKGLYGLSGKLTIQPEYQRNYIYADGGGADLMHYVAPVRVVATVDKKSLWLLKKKLSAFRATRLTALKRFQHFLKNVPRFSGGNEAYHGEYRRLAGSSRERGQG